MDKTLFAQTGEIRGKKSTGVFTFNFQFSPNDPELKQTKGDLFFLAQLRAASEDKASASAHSLYSLFKDRFYQTSGTNLKTMEEALDTAVEAVKQQDINGALVVANLWGSVLYIAKFGDAGVFLVRNKVAKKIEVSKIASGSLQDKDNILLADAPFSAATDRASLAAQISMDDFEEGLKALQEGVEQRSGTAFAIRLSIQEPVEATQKLLIADLDKPKQEVEPQLEDMKNKLVEVKDRLGLSKFKLRLKFLEGRRAEVKKFLHKAWEILNKYARKASFVIMSPWLPREPGAIEEANLKKRQRIAQIVVVLAVILITSVGVGFINHTRSVNREKFEAAITSVEGKLQDAGSLGEINPSQAKVFLAEAQEELDKLSSKNPKVKDLQKKLGELAAKINKIFKVELADFTDLTTLKGGIDTSQLKLAAGTLFVLDKGTGSIYVVSLSSKQTAILVSEKKGLQNSASSADYTYLQTKEGLFRVDNQISTESKLADASPSWKNIIAADTYRDNVYLLDKDAGQIWKHTPAGSGLGGPTAYFTQEFKNQAVSFAVDGSVWVAKKSEIFKFFGGKEDKFAVKDAPVGFGNIGNIYASEATTNLYVLDRSEGGVFVIEKSSGKYLGLYKNGRLTQAEAISVDEAKKTVYVLSEDAIGSFKLK